MKRILKLYKNLSFDGKSRFPLITSSFINSMNSNVDVSVEINFNRIGEDILLNMPYDEALKYNYGSISSDKFVMFFTIERLFVNEENRTYMSYAIDWYTTLMYANKISIGRSRLIRSSRVSANEYPQDIQPIKLETVAKKELKFTRSINFNNLGRELLCWQKPSSSIVITYADVNNRIHYLVSPLVDGLHTSATYYEHHTPEPSISFNVRSLTLEDILNGELFKLKYYPTAAHPEAETILPNSIIGIWYVPFLALFGEIKYSTTAIFRYGSQSDPGYFLFDFLIGNSRGVNYSANIDFDFYTDDMHFASVNDRKGNVIFTLPFGTNASSVNITLETSLTDLFISVFFNGNNKINSKAIGMCATVRCERVAFINDTYRNWSSGIKQIEQQERSIQINKNAAGNAGMLPVTGAIGYGAGVGTPQGPGLAAGVGMLGSFAATAIGWAVDRYYEPKINALQDAKYKLLPDEVISGDMVADLTDFAFLNVVMTTASSSDLSRAAKEKSEFGCNCNQPIASWTPATGVFQFADAEILGDVPNSIKADVVSKLQNGIKIVSV